MTELQERFLRKASAHLPLERVVEVHLFPPIRQGGLETGIAIVAADRLPDAADAPACDPTDDAAGPAPVAAEAAEATDAADAATPAAPGDLVADAVEEAVEAVEADAEVPEPDALAEGAALAEGIASAHGRRVPLRHTVYTARYRATLKGPERGRFEVDVHEEADAPLVTIDAVVRGVQHRAGEPTEPDRLTGDQLRTLAVPVATP